MTTGWDSFHSSTGATWSPVAATVRASIKDGIPVMLVPYARRQLAALSGTKGLHIHEQFWLRAHGQRIGRTKKVFVTNSSRIILLITARSYFCSGNMSPHLRSDLPSDVSSSIPSVLIFFWLSLGTESWSVHSLEGPTLTPNFSATCTIPAIFCVACLELE